MLFDIFNEDWAQTFATIGDILLFLLLYLIFLIIMAIFLKLALGLMSKSKRTEFGNVFLTSFLLTIIYALVFLFLGGWVAWLIVLVLAWLIISARHHTGFLGAIVITIIALLLYIIVAIILGLILVGTLLILPW